MKRVLVIAGILASTFATVGADELKRFSLDDAASIGTTIQTDSNVKAEGHGAVRIATRHPSRINPESTG